MPLEGTHNWRDYVNIATHRGLPLVLFVQAFDKGGSSSQIEEEVHVHQEQPRKMQLKTSRTVPMDQMKTTMMKGMR